MGLFKVVQKIKKSGRMGLPEEPKTVPSKSITKLVLWIVVGIAIVGFAFYMYKKLKK